VGYTDKGNDRDWTPGFQPLEVDEELWPIRQVPNTYKGTVAFAMAERTAQNLLIALNASVGSTQDATATGTNADGSIWVEPPVAGSEVRVMVGWDSLPKGTIAATSFGTAFGRTIYRQCINTQGVKETHQKGANKALFTVTFDLEFPLTGLQPFRDIFPASLVA
jgi:hypothetical protein